MRLAAEEAERRLGGARRRYLCVERDGRSRCQGTRDKEEHDGIEPRLVIKAATDPLTSPFSVVYAIL